MLTAQPPCYLARTFPQLFGKLFLCKTALLHKHIDFIRYRERQVDFFLYLRWYQGDHFPVSVSYIFHSLKVLSVSIVLDVIAASPLGKETQKP